MAICQGDQSGWAGEILDSMGETGTTTGSVVTWLQNNLGSLNTKISTSHYLSGVSGSGTCIFPDMNMATSGIYTEMYYCHFLSRKASQTLGALSFDWTFVEGDDQGAIRRVSNNDRAKTYAQLSKDCRDRLDELVKWYNFENNYAAPRQILGNSRVGSANSAMRDANSVYPPESIYSSYNVIWTSQSL